MYRAAQMDQRLRYSEDNIRLASFSAGEEKDLFVSGFPGAD